MSTLPSQPSPRNAAAQAPRRYFHALDGVRGLAALWVVIYHAHTAGHVTALVQSLPTSLRLPLFDWGYLGVPIFFALSGFVIAHSLYDRPLNRTHFQNFMVRRFLRLAPTYWTAMALTLALGVASSLVRGEPLTVPSLLSFASHLLFTQDLLNQPAISPVYWTLAIEMQFYALFYGLLWFNQRLNQGLNQQLQLVGERRHYYGFLAIAFILALIGLAAAPQLLSWRKFLLPYWYSFLMGILAHWSLHRRIDFRWLLLLIAACGAIALSVPSELPSYLASSTVALGILGLAWQGWLYRDIGPITTQLGTISYSLYLIHGSVFGPFFFVRERLLGSWVGTGSVLIDGVSLVGAIAASCIAAALLCKWVEQPSTRWSRHLRLSTQ